MPPTRPNILLLFSDQQRPDTMGCYGQALPVTPHLDALAATGVRFEHAYTCQPVCGPARACLQTGKYATQVGCWRNGLPLPQHERTLAHHLGDAGYAVGYVGKWHLASGGAAGDHATLPVPPAWRGGYRDYWVASDVLEFTSHGYDGHMFDAAGQRREFPPGRYRVDAVTDFAVEWLATRTAAQPFFLMVSYIEPHHQNDHERYEGPHDAQARWRAYTPPPDLAGHAGDWAANYPDYLGCCHALDASVARYQAVLEQQGLADNTLIIYCSDHGSHFRTRNAEYKRSCHDASIHIPLIIHGPGFAGGQAQGALVSLLDLPPTVLKAAGVTPPATMVGRSLQELVAGTAGDWRDAVLIQISEDHVGRALRTARWKYEVWVPSATAWSGSQVPASEVYTERYLYDLAADPHEQRNLVADPALAPVRQQLAARLQALLHDAGEAVPRILPAPEAAHG